VLSSNVLSEMVFLALLLPLLLFAERRTTTGDWQGAAVLGVAAGALCLVRSHAVVVIAALAISYAMRRHYRAAAVAVAAGLAVLLPWQLWALGLDAALPQALRGSYGSYAGWFVGGVSEGSVGFLPAVLWQNVITSTTIIMRSFSIAQHPLPDVIALMGILGLLLAGAVSFARRARVTILFALLYHCLVLIWPFSPLRFVWGIWPLLVLMLCAGAKFFVDFPTDSQEGRGIRFAGLACGAIVLAGALLFNVRGYANAWWGTVARSYAPRIRPQLEWVALHARPQDVIVAEDEGSVYLYTGRRAVPATSFTASQYLQTRDPAANAGVMREVMRVYNAEYLIAWAIPTQQAAQLLARPSAPQLVPIDTLGGATVYRRIRGR
jgi:hypothetical protein